MRDTAISIRGIGKRYALGETLSHSVLRDRIADGARALLRGFRGGRHPAERASDFWALRDVSFDVGEGEVVGIIGRNGAGKSTLLKVLSQITEPTEGEIRVRGRVASLLEVGTGFHPELTGRENVFLNGAILGMTHREIRSKFDAIVDFAGVARFIDTPVKRYSSGMYVRLAFAVAAHLEPEILLIDEVLAVGDAEFQRKCIGKMGDVARSGRTILFVSHNMAAVEALCPSAVLLQEGRVAAVGSSNTVIENYLGQVTGMAGDVDLVSHPGRQAGIRPVLKRLRSLNAAGNAISHVALGDTVCLEVSGQTGEPIPAAHLRIRIDRLTGQRAVTCSSRCQYAEPVSLNGPFSLSCTIKDCRLMPAPYVLTLSLLQANRDVIDEVSGIPFEVTPRDIYGTGHTLPPHTGTYVPDVVWHISGG
jgi:lipopolysaccharide transport system ATP-binding protein